MIFPSQLKIDLFYRNNNNSCQIFLTLVTEKLNSPHDGIDDGKRYLDLLSIKN